MSEAQWRRGSDAYTRNLAHTRERMRKLRGSHSTLAARRAAYGWTGDDYTAAMPRDAFSRRAAKSR